MQHIRGTYLETEALELEQNTSETVIPADPDVKNYSFTLVDGQVYYRENSIMTRPDLSPTARERVRGLIGLRDCVQELIRLQLADASDAKIQAQQSELNMLYDSFTGKYGLLNARPNAQAFATDSSYYLLCSLGQHRINGRIHIGGHAFCENQQDALCICSQGRTDSSCQAGPVSQNQIR